MRDVEYKEIFSKKLKHYMEANGKNQMDLMRDLKLSSSTVSSWCTGQKLPRMGKIQMLADYFGVNKSDLIEDKPASNDIPPNATPYAPTQRIPILGRISAGLPLYADEQIEGYTYTDLNHGGEYFALRVHGDSMDALGIKEGYLVIVRRQDYVDNGTICVVLVGDNEATMKRFYQDGDTVTLMPQSTNPKHMPQIYNLKHTPIHIIGKVVKVEFTLD